MQFKEVLTSAIKTNKLGRLIKEEEEKINSFRFIPFKSADWFEVALAELRKLTFVSIVKTNKRKGLIEFLYDGRRYRVNSMKVGRFCRVCVIDSPMIGGFYA